MGVASCELMIQSLSYVINREIYVHSFTICSFSPWLLDLGTASSASAVNGLFIVHLNYDAVVIHHTSFNRLDHIVCLCFHTVVTDKREENVESDLE